MLMYTGHLISLFLYISVFVTAVMSFGCVRRAKLYGPIRLIVPAFLASLVLQSGSFIALQIDWVWEDFNAVVGDATAFGWLAYDYFNGTALLLFATALRIWLGWRLEEVDELAGKVEVHFTSDITDSRSMHGRKKMAEKYK